MDIEELVQIANACLHARPGAALTFASGTGAATVKVLMTEDDERQLCTIGIGLLSALMHEHVLGEFALVVSGIARRERESGERAGEALLRHRFRDLLMG